MSVNVGSISLDKWSEGLNKELRKLNDIQLQAAFVKYVYSYLMPRIRAHTPVSAGEKHPPGYVHARDAWHASINASGSNSSIRIYNDKEDYAEFLEFGSEPGQKPWPSAGNIIKIYADEAGKAGPGKTKVRIRGRLLRKSGKTYYGRDIAGAVPGHSPGSEQIWAGGLFPGGTLSKGGAITRAHMALQNELGIGDLVKVVANKKATSPSSVGKGTAAINIGTDLGSVTEAGIIRRAINVVTGGAVAFGRALAGDIGAAAEALWKRFSGR